MSQRTSPYFGRDVGTILIFSARGLDGVAQALQDLVSPLARDAVHRYPLSSDFDPALLDGNHGTGMTVVVCIDREQTEAAERLNLLLAKRSIPCLFNSLSGRGLQVGPWTYYGHTPCWECDRTTSGFFRTHGAHPSATADYRDAELAMSISEAFAEVFDGTSPLIDGVISTQVFGERDDSVSRSLKDPLCTVCSIWSRQPTEQFYVQ